MLAIVVATIHNKNSRTSTYGHRYTSQAVKSNTKLTRTKSAIPNDKTQLILVDQQKYRINSQ